MNQSGKKLGWNWFKFIIYAQLFLWAFFDVYQAITFFTGAHYGAGSDGAAFIYAIFGELKTLDVVMGICCIALAGVSIFVRQKLAHFEKAGTKYYLILQASTLGINLLYAVVFYGLVYTKIQDGAAELMQELGTSISSAVTSSIFWLVTNKIYFDNRKEYFVEGGVSNPAQYLVNLSNGMAQPAQQMAGSQPQGQQPWQAQPQQLQGQQPWQGQSQQPWQGQSQGNQPQQPQGDQSQQSQPQQPWQEPQPEAPQNAEQPQVQEHGVLIGLKGLYAGAEIPMKDGDEVTFGRSETNNLIFATEKRISREHCKIRWDAKKEKYIFRDYSSSGSYINGSEDCLPQNLDLEVACGSEIALGNQDNVFLLK